MIACFLVLELSFLCVIFPLNGSIREYDGILALLSISSSHKDLVSSEEQFEKNRYSKRSMISIQQNEEALNATETSHLSCYLFSEPVLPTRLDFIPMHHYDFNADQ